MRLRTLPARKSAPSLRGSLKSRNHLTVTHLKRLQRRHPKVAAVVGVLIAELLWSLSKSAPVFVVLPFV